jgi:hypothetical protein
VKFERLLVHLDVDVIDFNDLPLAENYSKKQGAVLQLHAGVVRGFRQEREVRRIDSDGN